jgi:hypothetical protein
LFPSHFRSPFSFKKEEESAARTAPNAALDSKTNDGAKRFSENDAFLKKFRKKVSARKKPPLDGLRVERRFRGFLSFERKFLETLQRFSGGA